MYNVQFLNNKGLEQELSNLFVTVAYSSLNSYVLQAPFNFLHINGA